MNRYRLLSGLCLLDLLIAVILSALNENRHWIGAQWFCILGFWLGVGHTHYNHRELLHRFFSTNALGKP